METYEASRMRKLVSLFLTISYFTVNGLLTTQIGAFFPKEAEQKGLSKTMTGIITGLNDAIALFLGFFIHNIDGCFNLKTVFWISYLVYSLAIVSFGLLTFINVKWVYITTALLIRTATGVTGCAICAVFMPMSFQLFPEYRGHIAGSVQFSFEGGALFGPIIGSAFFKLDGFYLPFVASGCFSLLFVFMSAIFILPHETHRPDIDEITPLNEDAEKTPSPILGEHNSPSSPTPTFEPFTMKKVLQTLDIYLASAPHFTVAVTFGLFTVFLAPWLMELHGLSETHVPYFFVPAPAVAIILSPFIGYLVNSAFKWPVYIFTPAVGSVGCGLLILDTFWDNFASVALFFLFTSLACFGFCYIAGWVSGSIILDDLFHLHAKDDIHREYRLIMSNWCNNICFLGGRWVGSTILGGFIFDYLGFDGVVIAHGVFHIGALVCAFAIYGIVMSKSSESDDDEEIEDFEYCKHNICFKH